MSLGVDQVLVAEADWYGLDLDAQGVPALGVASGGPFDIVTPYLRRLSQKRRALYLTHGPSRHANLAKDTVRVDHEVLALVLWAAVGAGGRAQNDQQAADEAVARVVDRVLGPAGDTTHGGRWWMVGPPNTEPPGPAEMLAWNDAISAVGAAYTFAVRYTVTELRER